MTRERARAIFHRATDRMLRIARNPAASPATIERHRRFQLRAHWLLTCVSASRFDAPGFWKITQAM